MKTGFKTFTKQDFLAVVRSFQYYDSFNYQEISKYIKKNLDLTTRFIKKLLSNTEIVGNKYHNKI